MVGVAQAKINVYQADREFEPKARHPTPGGADLCLLAADPIEHVLDELDRVSAG